MITNLAVFIRGLNVEIENVPRQAEKIVRQIAFAIDRELVRRTPVGNPDLWKVNQGKTRGDPGYVGANYTGGRARANWLPTLDMPSEDVIDTPDPTGATALAKMGPVTARFKIGQKIIISNNLQYIQRLNDGHSTQAPIGFIESAIQVGVKTVLKR